MPAYFTVYIGLDGVAYTNGFISCSICRAMLVPGFQNGLHPVICKFTLDSEDVGHEHHVLAQLAGVPAVTGVVNPVQLLALKPGTQVLIDKPGKPFPCNTRLRVCSMPPFEFLEQKQLSQCCSAHIRKLTDFHACAETVFGAKHCLVMPLYPSTLQHLPVPMDELVVLACGRSLETTLIQIHSKGYGHNDIKAANVYITADGVHLLIDFKAAPVLFPLVKSSFCLAAPHIIYVVTLRHSPVTLFVQCVCSECKVVCMQGDAY